MGAVDMVDMVDTVVDTVDTVARDLPKLFLNPKPHLKPKLMLTTDMADTAVDTDMEVMVDTVVMEVMDMVDIVASDLPLPKLTPMLKPKLTVMVDTVVVMEATDMVDTVARGPLMPNPMLRLTMVDTMVDTDTAADTVDTADTVMVDVTTDRFY